MSNVGDFFIFSPCKIKNTSYNKKVSKNALIKTHFKTLVKVSQNQVDIFFNFVFVLVCISKWCYNKATVSCNILISYHKRGTVMMGNLTHDEKLKFEEKAKIGWNYKIVDGLRLELRIFNLTHQKRSEAKVDLWGHFKNMSKWLQILH